jgi:hypothetical protein
MYLQSLSCGRVSRYYVCVCVCVPVPVRVRVCIYITYMHTYMNMHTCIHTHTYIRNIHTHVQIHAYICHVFWWHTLRHYLCVHVLLFWRALSYLAVGACILVMACGLRIWYLSTRESQNTDEHIYAKSTHIYMSIYVRYQPCVIRCKMQVHTQDGMYVCTRATDAMDRVCVHVCVHLLM